MNKIIAVFSLLTMLLGCNATDEVIVIEDNFNRKVMLENWADNLIIPAYENLNAQLTALTNASNAFIESPDEDQLNSLRERWLAAYLAWQKVDMYDVGKAGEITLRNYMNVYPLDAESLQSSLLTGGYDLTLVNRQDEQGFPALDFLLHGLADTDAEIVAFYTNDTQGSKYTTYLSDVVTRMQSLSKSVLDDWQNGYRDTFVSLDGSSSTASVNSLINDYVFYYEKYLRAGKIGIPAGVFSGTSRSDLVEASYRSDVSKVLFLEALGAYEAFFNGEYFNGGDRGISIKDYLDALNTMKEGEDLSLLINNQFEASRTQAERLSDDFGDQVDTNNTIMLETYDELQKNLVLIKLDMLQALNVRIDYVDADGD